MARLNLLRRAEPRSHLDLLAILFFLALRSAMDNASDPSLPFRPILCVSGSQCVGLVEIPAEPSITAFSDQRSRLYDKMARDLEEHGPAFLKGGETSQSLSLSDLFELRNGVVTPILKNTSIYHFSMFHASHHLTPVMATDSEIEAEVNAVKQVAEAICPLKIVLDRVVLTSTGVLLGCWQVISGTDPAEIRAKLRNALPRAPEKQLYDPVLLHTSFARLLGRPKLSSEVARGVQLLQTSVTVLLLSSSLRH
ncbi:hypothetical protein ACMD2_20211 [Ananas comosus]|uniref:Uncharacterized protein n=1 Tax=Ananas comosus TaxID=4615 RepID=A0A199UUF4_ANACO|nr:hypothetical protein ACMD2_20211 [Ananas comosus]